MFVISREANSGVSQLSTAIGHINEGIDSLASHTNSIDSILDTIRSISEQTN